jgi:hypothetical protein
MLSPNEDSHSWRFETSGTTKSAYRAFFHGSINFEGASPNMNDLLRAFSDEHHLWCLARKLDALGPALATG